MHLINPWFQTNGYFRYIDGWNLNSASWARGEPKKDQPCVYLDVDGKWKTASCNVTMNSVCLQSTGMILSRLTLIQFISHASVSLCKFK